MKSILFFMTMTVLLFGQLANAQSVKIKVVQENDRQVMYYGSVRKSVSKHPRQSDAEKDMRYAVSNGNHQSRDQNT